MCRSFLATHCSLLDARLGCAGDGSTIDGSGNDGNDGNDGSDGNAIDSSGNAGRRQYDGSAFAGIRLQDTQRLHRARARSRQLHGTRARSTEWRRSGSDRQERRAA